MATFTKTGAGAIRDIWATARRDHEELIAQAFSDPDPNLPRDGIKPGKWEGAPHNALPPHCPVHVIGYDGDGALWCRNATGDLVKVEKWDMATITHLFAPFINYAFWAWPAFGKVKINNPEKPDEVIEILEVKRVERDKLFTCLGTAGKKRPLFDPDKQHRGRGGWVDNGNNFMWHSGKYLWRSVNGRMQNVPPGEHDGYLYTRQPTTIQPWDGPVSPAESPARRILKDLQTWNWERPVLDPLLALGWPVTALMGGALKARPIVFTTGGAGVGKSTFHELLGHLLNNVVIQSIDTTAAGIYQRMKHDALPLMIDELESKAGSTKATSVIELARVAYTGGEIGRGGNDHNAVSFTMRSSFLFSAINPPPMGNQDRSRMAILNLQRLDVSDGIRRPALVRNDVDGRMILRQVMDGWGAFSTKILDDWWNLLSGRGLDSRAIDTFGTLLAAAEVVLGPEGLEEAGLPITDADHLGEMIAEATRPDRALLLDNWHKCLNHLLSCTIDAWRDGVKPSVGGVAHELSSGIDVDLKWAKDRLELVNLSARGRGELGDGGGPYLAVPADGPQLSKLFAATEWQQGVWTSALKQAPASIVIKSRDKSVLRINGAAMRCLLIDMTAFGKYAEAQ